MASYTVKAPLIQVRVEDGSFVHLYEGASVPDNADPDHVKSLLESEMIAKSDTSDSKKSSK